MLHPFLRGKDGSDSLEFPGAERSVWEWEGGESGGRVTGDTADGRDAGFRTHLDDLNRRRPGTAVPGTGSSRCKHPLVESGRLPGVPMSDTEPRRLEDDSIPRRYPSARLGKTMNGEYSREHC